MHSTSETMQLLRSADRMIIAVAAYFPDSYGGAERQARILSEALARQGTEVTLVAPTRDRNIALNQATPFGQIIRKRVTAYPNLGGRNVLSFLAWTSWFCWRFCNSEFRGVPIYVFHARLHALGPALAARLNNAKLMVKLGGGGEASEFEALRVKKYFYGKWIERYLTKHVHAFVANSQQIVSELVSLGISDKRIFAFNNGVEVPDNDWLNHALSQRSGTRFIYAARLNPDKNVSVLYDAMLKLVDTFPTARLRLIGEGTEKIRLSQREDGRTTIVFPGYVENIYDELESADYFVCASTREGQSNALLEAMSAGVIPIVYAASGVREVVEHGINGFIVEEASAQAFCDAMSEAMQLNTASRIRMTMAARLTARAKISIDAVALKTRAITANGVISGKQRGEG